MVTDSSGRVVPNAPNSVASIDAQQNEIGIGPDGKATLGYTVRFTTKKGVKGSVFIPQSMYSPDNVRARVQAHAYELDQVQGLAG